ncbi:SDR family oxidoreductase [Streptomyces sp. NPDC096080]|uniref:SDR family oxidoreductase n=1 Tax=Streptomyces sp. NPDC096080 TaxID=3156693 RepID=UPI00331C5CE9
MTAIAGSVVLVTGGSRGIGRALVQALHERGAKKVYATARDPRTVTHPDAVPLALEVGDPASVAAAAEQAQDVSEFETNFFGPLLTARAFVPIIERNGGGHLLNVHSVLSWIATHGSYSASKAALWSQTNSLRLDLKPRGIDVTGLHVGYVDTDMAAAIDAPKSSPERVAEQALDGIETGAFEVLADELTRQVKAGLAGDPAALYPQLAA